MMLRAEQLHRQFFQPRHAARQVAWEPPVDVLELEREVLILVALPGVNAEQVEAVPAVAPAVHLLQGGDIGADPADVLPHPLRVETELHEQLVVALGLNDDVTQLRQRLYILLDGAQ